MTFEAFGAADRIRFVHGTAKELVEEADPQDIGVLLLDGGPQPLPMHVVSAFADIKDKAVKDKAIKSSTHRPWIWETDKALPDFPPKVAPGRGAPRHDAHRKSSADAALNPARDDVNADAKRYDGAAPLDDGPLFATAEPSDQGAAC